jgi:hypothetical protein
MGLEALRGATVDANRYLISQVVAAVKRGDVAEARRRLARYLCQSVSRSIPWPFQAHVFVVIITAPFDARDSFSFIISPERIGS